MDPALASREAKKTLAGLPDEVLGQILRLKLARIQLRREPGKQGKAARRSVAALGRTSRRFVDPTRKALLHTLPYFSTDLYPGLTTFLEDCRTQDGDGYGKYIRELSAEVGVAGAKPSDLGDLLRHCTQLVVLDLGCHPGELADVRYIRACEGLKELRLRIDQLTPTCEQQIGQLISGSQLERIWLSGLAHDPEHEGEPLIELDALPQLRYIGLKGSPCSIFSAIINATTQSLHLTCIDSIPEIDDTVATRIERLELQETPHHGSRGILGDGLFDFDVISFPVEDEEMKGIEQIEKMSGLVRLVADKIAQKTYKRLPSSLQQLEVAYNADRQQPLLDFLQDRSRSPVLRGAIVKSQDAATDDDDEWENASSASEDVADEWDELKAICSAREIQLKIG